MKLLKKKKIECLMFGGFQSGMLKLINQDFEMVNAKIFNILDKNALILLGIAQPICVVTRASRNKLGLVSKSSARHLYCPLDPT